MVLVYYSWWQLLCLMVQVHFKYHLLLDVTCVGG